MPPHVQKVVEHAAGWIEKGCTVHFQFNCKLCGINQAFSEPNTLFARGGKCEICGTVTELSDPAANLGFILIASGGDPVQNVMDAINEFAKRSKKP